MARFPFDVAAGYEVHISASRNPEAMFTQIAHLYIDGAEVEPVVDTVGLRLIPATKRQRRMEIEPRADYNGDQGASSFGVTEIWCGWRLVCDDSWHDGKWDHIIEILVVKAAARHESSDRVKLSRGKAKAAR